MYKIIIYVKHLPTVKCSGCVCLKMLQLVSVVSQRLYYVLDNFFSHVIWH